MVGNLLSLRALAYGQRVGTFTETRLPRSRRGGSMQSARLTAEKATAARPHSGDEDPQPGHPASGGAAPSGTDYSRHRDEVRFTLTPVAVGPAGGTRKSKTAKTDNREQHDGAERGTQNRDNEKT